ncbi:MAG: TraC family protein [Deltaproteobacteria bacterium]|nr:TraC family protein [Deltaproteobacteria bacterium]
MGLSLGMSKRELRTMVERDKFSDYLPYLSYNPDTNAYYNTDDTVGFIWECIPLYSSSEKITQTLMGIFKTGIPPESVLQFILYADPYIDNIMDEYTKLKTRNNPLIKKSVEEYARFLTEGTKGVSKLQGIPLRNFRLFVSIKIPSWSAVGKTLDDIKASMYDILKGAHLNPSCLPPEGLISMLSGIFNDTPPRHQKYSDNKEISKQIILADTDIIHDVNKLTLGSRVCKITTPKSTPAFSSMSASNTLSGDIWGVVSDNNQIKCPFIFVYNIVFDDLKSAIGRKTAWIMQQHTVSSLSASLTRRKEEFLWATDEMERGEMFFRVIPVVAVIDSNEEKARESIVRVKRLWEQKGYVMQEEKGILPPLFLSCIPFGLYNIGDNVKMLDRDFNLPSKTIVDLLPIQADIQSISIKPQTLFIGRKGEVVGLDIYDMGSVNMNALIVGASGGGKSVLVNHIISSYYGSGAYIRIVDIGGSYKKTCSMLGGKFIEFTNNSNICLNPFSNIKEINEDLHTIAKIVLQMVYSFTKATPIEIEATLIKDAVRWAYDTQGQDATIDTVYQYLIDYRKYTQDASDDLVETASTLARNLRDFTSQGAYGRWFCGKSTLDISKNQFVVLELEHLKEKKELFNVIVLQVLNYVTFDLYLSNREDSRMVVFDEAWQFFKEGGYLADVIEDGDRRARKYKGSFIKVVQSIMDVKQFGNIGNVLRSNSAHKFYLESSDYERAKKEDLIDFDGFAFEMLKSIKSNRPKYSEFFLESPMGTGALRLLLSPFLYYMYTSDASDNSKINALLNSGKTYLEAIENLAKDSN